MAETQVISHLLAFGIISIMLNSFLLMPLAGLNLTGAILYFVYSGLGQEVPFTLSAGAVYIAFFLFSVVFAVVTLIGSALGFMYQDHVRKIGLKMLIITNSVLFLFFGANFVVMIAGFIVGGVSNALLYIPVAVAPGICLCQCGLFGYGSFYICMICKSFDWKRDDRKPA
ncbi:hypothetical protein LOD99_5944 [Oopsacas minuta]|uniref:Uncharacterized protein n=1 Tax=Oopsacas minuta TaxID=111878 RepID=A0AAV7JMY4_9METZ|nr:hypothetical protein LOD99_5944 [Oopsacas minuta]